MGFDWILSSQGNTTEDDEDEDEVGEVWVMDEIVAGNSQTENGKEITKKSGCIHVKACNRNQLEVIGYRSMVELGYKTFCS